MKNHYDWLRENLRWVADNYARFKPFLPKVDTNDGDTYTK